MSKPQKSTIGFLGIWGTDHNPNFNSGEFAIIKGQAEIIASSLPGKRKEPEPV